MSGYEITQGDNVLLENLSRGFDFSVERSSVFSKNRFSAFVFFDYLYVSEPHEAQRLVEHAGRPALVGIVDGDGVTLDEDGNRRAFRITPSMPLDVIRAAYCFESEIGEGCINDSVDSAFLAIEGQEWCIWFSTYREVAIGAFADQQSAERFRQEFDWIAFMSDDECREIISAHPDIIYRDLIVGVSKG